MHVGDSITEIENFQQFNLVQEQIDIAILPFWFLTGARGQKLVRDHIRPKQIIAVHISPETSETTTAQVKQAFPDAIAFTKMLEKKVF